MFSKLLDKILSNKRNILFVLVGISLFFVLSDSAFAADAAKTSQQSLDEAKQTTSNVLKWIGTTISVFLALITYLATVFLSPEWINGSLFGLNGYFKSVWVLVSNVVYLIFAFILIWIAFMNIIGKGQEKYALKQALPKFIVGILIVPFSWFLIQFILSLSAILTISALNLPFETFDKFNTSLSTTEIPTKCTLNLKSLGESKEGETKEDSKKFFKCGDAKKSLEELRKSEDSVDSIFGVIGLYTYGLLSMESMDKLNKFDMSSVTNMSDLIVKLLFDVLFIIVYSVLIIAIGLVLMVRGIYIWVYMMISPLFGLMYFFDKTSGGGEFFDKFNLKQFISLAFVPVYTMLALSFGLLFIFAAGNGMSYNSEFKDIDTVKLSQPTGAGDQDLTVGSFTLEITGSPANPNNITGFFDKVAEGGMGIIGTLIMKIFGIVVLWGVVMAALRSNDITKAIVEPLHSFGGQVGGLVTKAPQYAPIFGGQSMTSLSQIGSAAQTYYGSTKPGEASKKFMEKHQLFGSQMGSTLAADKLSKTVSSGGDVSAIAKEIRNVVKENGESGVAYRNTPAINSLLEAAEKLGISAYKGKKAGDIKNADDYVELIKALDGHLQPGGNDIIVDGKMTTAGNYTKTQFDEYIRGLKKGSIDETTSSNGSKNITSNLSGSTNPSITIDGATINLVRKGNEIDKSGGLTDYNYQQIAKSVITDKTIKSQYPNFTSELKAQIDKYIKDGVYDETGSGNGKIDKPTS